MEDDSSQFGSVWDWQGLTSMSGPVNKSDQGREQVIRGGEGVVLIVRSLGTGIRCMFCLWTAD